MQYFSNTLHWVIVHASSNIFVLLYKQEPVEIQVGSSHYVTRQSGAKRRKILTRDTFQYVPLLSTLKQVLQIQSVRHEIMRSPQRNGEMLHDFSDGSVFKQHDFFKTNPHALQIIAYYDEVETCNPLGSSSGKFKLGCIFFTLGNIRPSLRSSLKCIFLVCVAKSPTIKANGIDSILKPFLDDITTLCEVGITLQFAGKEEVWRGALLAFLSDNLAAHELGGFKESFSFARRFCRSCLTNKELSQSHFRESQFTLRNPESHAEQCCQLDGPDRLSVSVEYGINRRSSLDSLPYFSVVEHMPHDIMHDLFEGVLPYEMILLIRHCVSHSYMTLDTLNSRLSAFDFGYTEIGDRPAPIQDASKIRQTASQMWLLAILFPVLVGDLIPRGDNNWDCFLKLLRICEVCASPSLSIDSAAYLEILIEEHHQEFVNLYPNQAIIPKMHFMVHFPSQILNFGPLVHAWTMRHEAKLRIIKRAARVSNYKNVCQTVARRHQHLLCFYMHSNLLGKAMKIGPCKALLFTSQSKYLQLLLTQQYELTNQSHLCTTSYVTYNGITFKTNAFVLLSYDVLSPHFCKISTILKIESGEIILVLNDYETEYYDSHYRAYCIYEHPTPSLRLFNVKNLPYCCIFHLRRLFAMDHKSYIVFRCQY